MPQLHPEKIAHRLEQLTELSVALGHGQGGRGAISGRCCSVSCCSQKHERRRRRHLYRPAADGRQLDFHISVNDSLASCRADVGLPGVPLFDDAGQPNLASVAAYAANCAAA
jgi:hypothetical protein